MGNSLLPSDIKLSLEKILRRAYVNIDIKKLTVTDNPELIHVHIWDHKYHRYSHHGYFTFQFRDIDRWLYIKCNETSNRNTSGIRIDRIDSSYLYCAFLMLKHGNRKEYIYDTPSSVAQPMGC